MRTYVIGDIHGAYRALMQCFERSSFNKKRDRLISLGDVCDGYPDVRECFNELLSCAHCDLIIGNHDMWTLDWALTGDAPEAWRTQGGDNTITSYEGGPMPKEHIEFLRGGKLWLELDDKLFVHAGFDPDKPLEDQDAEELIWDRSLIYAAWNKNSLKEDCRFGRYKDIFIGHTPTALYSDFEPIRLCNIWAIDTGAGWSGKLTIMDIDTKEYWQSDPTPGLYNGISPRR